jgi:hypothetical protein
MLKILHLLRSEPDDTVAELISTMSGDGVTVINLYPDDINGKSIDWDRLVEDIMAHDKVVSWW